MRGLRGRGRGEVDVRRINCQTTAGDHTIHYRSDTRSAELRTSRIAAAVSSGRSVKNGDTGGDRVACVRPVRQIAWNASAADGVRFAWRERSRWLAGHGPSISDAPSVSVNHSLVG